jgi:hypothetical protein
MIDLRAHLGIPDQPSRQVEPPRGHGVDRGGHVEHPPGGGRFRRASGFLAVEGAFGAVDEHRQAVFERVRAEWVAVSRSAAGRAAEDPPSSSPARVPNGSAEGSAGQSTIAVNSSSNLRIVTGRHSTVTGSCDTCSAYPMRCRSPRRGADGGADRGQRLQRQPQPVPGHDRRPAELPRRVHHRRGVLALPNRTQPCDARERIAGG